MHHDHSPSNLIPTKLRKLKLCSRISVAKNDVKSMKRRRTFDVSRCYCCSVLAVLSLGSLSVAVSAVDLNNFNISSSDTINGHTRTVIVNAGENVTLICNGAEDRSNESIFWIHDTKDSERVISGN